MGHSAMRVHSPLCFLVHLFGPVLAPRPRPSLTMMSHGSLVGHKELTKRLIFGEPSPPSTPSNGNVTGGPTQRPPPDPNDKSNDTQPVPTPTPTNGTTNGTTPVPTPTPTPTNGTVTVWNSTQPHLDNTTAIGNTSQPTNITVVPTPVNTTTSTVPVNNTDPVNTVTTTTAPGSNNDSSGSLSSGSGGHSGGGSSVQAGEIIGIVAGALAGLIILGWLLSLPIRKAASRKRAIEWLDFNPKHGTGEADDDIIDDDDPPMNSAEAVLGRAHTNMTQTSGGMHQHGSGGDGSGGHGASGYEMSQNVGGVQTYGTSDAGYPYTTAPYGQMTPGGWYTYNTQHQGYFPTDGPAPPFTNDMRDVVVTHHGGGGDDSDAYDAGASGMVESGDLATRKVSAGAASVSTYVNHSQSGHDHKGGAATSKQQSPQMTPIAYSAEWTPIAYAPAPADVPAAAAAAPYTGTSPTGTAEAAGRQHNGHERDGSLMEQPSIERMGTLRVVNNE